MISFRVPNLILAGVGSLERLGEEARNLEAKKALVVTDKGVVASGIAGKVRGLLEKEGIPSDLFDGVISDPDIACADTCVETAKRGDYDLILGVGGGSSMDIASVASVMCTNPGKIQDYLGVNLVKKPGIPTILIPTTAGTGAEATPNAILTDSEAKLKKAIVSPYILPRVAIVDPLLSLSMPPPVTSSTGIDALTHAIETYTSNNATILSDLFAREAIVLIGRSLRTAVANGSNLEARSDMSIGSLYAGIAITNAGVTAVHALAYPLGGHFNVAHGIANGLLLPYVMEFNVLGNIPKFARIAGFLGEKVEHLSLLEQAYHAARTVKAIYRDLEIPQSLTELGVPNEAIPDMAEAAMNVTRLMTNNPREMRVEDVERIYEKAL
ncbi:MAG: iron-containing alcohol dehydrogenase [Deltaproteobacteria bacterium]|nr:iron-containing alcohol dehydrogenase [Deltaproteobacteria bacterium]MBW2121874.1 iron-containing alcohol dehydrogenase [Deltaproteobacteria bacterium]